MRRLIVAGSVTGAPGVTTTALAVSAAWPQGVGDGVRPVVVEADPSGGDLMLRFGLPVAPSLLDVAAEARAPHPGSLLGAASELPCGVRAVPAVPGRAPCREALRLLASEGGRRVLLGDDRDRGTVLLDVGRLTDDVGPVLGTAGDLVLVTRGGAEPLTQVSVNLPGKNTSAGRLTLAVVGPCSYSAAEITQTLGVDAVYLLPWDPRGVAALTSPKARGLRGGTFRRPPLMRAAQALARLLAQPRERGDADRAPRRQRATRGRAGVRDAGSESWSSADSAAVPAPEDGGS
ncbi:hypothetical protein Sm713_10450 [Streptomyces sp. TS71-3]|nr:hypothetical protein Sm713_10450 [Streptomyces sp. TS71-3]